MKIKSLILAMAACAGLFSACSNEIEGVDENGSKEESVKDAYASFSFVMPNAAGTRAANQVEEGSAVENMVTDVNIYLFDQAGIQKQMKSLVRADFTPINNGSAIEYTTKTPFEVSTGDYNVYIIVNPTSQLTATETMNLTDFLAQIENVPVTTGEYCASNNFMMSNADEKEATHVVITAQNTKESPASVTVNVERTAAKITFVSKVADNTYTITNGENDNVIGNVVFDAYKIINTRNSAYNYKRVGASQESNVVGALEGTNKYVIDNIFDQKSAKFKKEEVFIPNYSRKFTDYVAFRQITSTGVNSAQTLAYCLENTMNATAQIYGYTTAVILRAKATVTGVNDGEKKDLYKYNNHFYNTLYDLVAASNPKWTDQAKTDGLDVDIIGIKDGIEDGKSVEDYINSIANNAALLHESFAVDYYMGGYCYYTAWIRHINSNDINGVMEFAIVRNNVYKISINSVSQIGSISSGTPGKPENGKEPDVDPTTPNPEIPGEIAPDPEPSDPSLPFVPETPDESEKSYLNITIDVLPWTVRNNDLDL